MTFFIFQSCKFHPCDFVRHFPVLQIPVTQTSASPARTSFKHVFMFQLHVSFCYPAIPYSMGGILSLLYFLFCTVTDFSSGVLPIGVKYYMAVRPHLGQVFSHFGGIASGMGEFWTPRGGSMAGYVSCWSTCFFVFVCQYQKLLSKMTYYVSTSTLTPSTPAVPNCCCSKGSAPYWSNPLFLIFDVRALARPPECPNVGN